MVFSFFFFTFYKLSPTERILPKNFHILNLTNVLSESSLLLYLKTCVLVVQFTYHIPFLSQHHGHLHPILTLVWLSVWIWENHLATISHLEERGWKSFF